MNKKENNINESLIEKITYLEEKYDDNFSNTQKILLTTDGSITAILDVLYDKIKLSTISQELENADKRIAEHFNINEGDEVNNRVIIMYKDKQPLIFAKSYIPYSKITNEIKKDLKSEDIPIGRIIKNYKLETRREIGKIKVVEPDDKLKKIYNTDELFLTRDYDIIHNNEKFMWIQESFPISYFREDISKY